MNRFLAIGLAALGLMAIAPQPAKADPSDLLTIPTIIRDTITTAVPITITATAITTTSHVTTTIIPGGTITVIVMMIK